MNPHPIIDLTDETTGTRDAGAVSQFNLPALPATSQQPPPLPPATNTMNQHQTNLSPTFPTNQNLGSNFQARNNFVTNAGFSFPNNQQLQGALNYVDYLRLQQQQLPQVTSDSLSQHVFPYDPSYSQPKILNTDQYLQKIGISTNPPPPTLYSNNRNYNISTDSPQYQLPFASSASFNAEKRRILPPTVITPFGTTGTNPANHHHHHQQQQQQQQRSSNNPYYNNLYNRQQIIHQHSNYPPGYRPPTQPPSLLKVLIVFSLINSDEFTARVETGSVPLELVKFLHSIQGSRFDFKAKRFIFPIILHDQLQTTLQQKYNCTVEPIPRAVLAAAQLKSRSLSNHQGNTPSGQSEEEIEAKDRELNEQLSAFIPRYVLTALAPFQKEAVKFIMDKKGRALIGDEMGLGKTRTGIAAACVYRRDWPVLVVCPSSARHHWHSELLTILVTNNPSEQTENKNERMDIQPSGDEELQQQKDSNQSSSSSNTAAANPAEPITIIDMTNPSSKPTAAPLSFPTIKEEEIVIIEKTNHFQQRPMSDHQNVKFFIISYSLIAKLLPVLETIAFNVMLVDESHYIKSRHAKRTQSLVPMIQKSHHAILLTGTPALSRPLELFTQLNALLPQEWNDFKAFGKRYCQDATGKQVNAITKQQQTKKFSLFANSHQRFKGFGDNAYKGANHTQELHVILTSTIMIRRLKKDILLQLPKKKRYLMKVEIEDPLKRSLLEGMLFQLRKYEELIAQKNHAKQNKKKNKKMITTTTTPAQLINSSSSSGNGNGDGNDESTITNNAIPGGNGLRKDNNLSSNSLNDLTAEQEVELTVLKQAKKNLLLKLFTQSGEAKLPAILTKLDKLFLKNPHFTGKILLFAHHHNVLNQLSRHLQKSQIPFIRIDGGTSSKERHQLTQSFQQDIHIRVAILGITAAGIALTLTSANIVCFLELYWTPGSLIQAEDRVHRIGQLKNVKIFYFFGINSIDELLWPLVRKKMQLLGEFVEGTNDQDLTAAVLNSNANVSSSMDPNDNNISNHPLPSIAINNHSTNNNTTNMNDLGSSFNNNNHSAAVAAGPPAAGSREQNPSEVMDPVTKKIYNLDTDEDILQLVDELAEEELQTISSVPDDPTVTINPTIINIDDSADEEEEEFKELAAIKKNSKKKKRKHGKLSSSQNDTQNEAVDDDEEGEAAGGGEGDSDDEEDSEDGQAEDEYEEYLKRVDPPDILATVYLQMIENEQRKNKFKQEQQVTTIAAAASGFTPFQKANTVPFPYLPHPQLSAHHSSFQPPPPPPAAAHSIYPDAAIFHVSDSNIHQ